MNVVSQGWRRLVVGVAALGLAAAVTAVAAEAPTSSTAAGTAKVVAGPKVGQSQPQGIWEW